MSDKRLQLDIDGMTSEGLGIGRRGRDVYFIPGALPGEQVTVALNGRRKKVWQTRLISIDSMSSDRTEPECQHYQRCGGCDLQHLSYQAQLVFKQQRVEREFHRQGLSVSQWEPALSGNSLHYRRKARLGIRYSKEKNEIYFGFREAGSEHITNIDRCIVLPDRSAFDWEQWRAQLATLDARSRLTQLEVIDADNSTALVLRTLKPMTDVDAHRLITFVENLQGQEDAGKPLQLWLRESKEGVPRLLWPERSEPLSHHVEGMPLTLQLSDFFQINGAVNRAMVTQALDWLKPGAESVVWDLFAGHGNFSMPLASKTGRVIAVEGQASMVSSLKAQAESLALPLQAITTDLSRQDALVALASPESVLLDPPRAGAKEVVEQLAARCVPRILYVSCDPATLARDLAVLCQSGYTIERAGIMDMFPQTHHVETMVLLTHEGVRHG